MKIELPVGKHDAVMLTTDDTCYIVSKRYTKKDGSHDWRNVAYCSCPESAFNRILEMNLRVSDATTLMELKDDLDRARQTVTDTWSTAFKE
jgi:hypothetical protein